MKKLVIGIDEAGRGPLAGPVAVGIVMTTKAIAKSFFKRRPLRDSKKMTAREREKVFAEIRLSQKKGKLNWAVSFVSAKVIDQIGINRAIGRAIEQNFKKLGKIKSGTKIELDGGLKVSEKFGCSRATIKGDEKIPVIALASVVAKVSRDHLMEKLAKKFPQYHFEQHKGYGTKAHYRAIKKFGVIVIHRKTYLWGLPKK